MAGMRSMMKHKVEQENASSKNNDDARIVNGALFALRMEVKYSVPEPRSKNFQRCSKAEAHIFMSFQSKTHIGNSHQHCLEAH